MLFLTIRFSILQRLLTIAIVVFSGFASAAFAQVVLSEIMFDADTLENHNEFVEIFNAGDEIVSLNFWTIGDSMELDGIIDAGNGLNLEPGQFGIILDASYFDNSTIYDDAIPDSALIITIDDGSFGKSGWSNSTPEPVILVDAAGDTVQKYYYSLNNKPGFSDEKIFLTSDNSKENWSNSKIFRGTPGRINSVSPLQHDVGIDSLWSFPEYPVEESSFLLWVSVTNLGTDRIESLAIHLFEDANKNQVMDSDEILSTRTFSSSLSWGDSVHLKLDVSPLNAGYHHLGVHIEVPSDQNVSNNTRLITIEIESLQDPLVINEIMFKPQKEFSEWVELFNVSENKINLFGWHFADSKDTLTVSEQNSTIQPGEFLVLCKDSTTAAEYNIPLEKTLRLHLFPTLNNDSDDLKLMSPSGRIVDRVSYLAGWMGRETEPGISLERINPAISSQSSENWAASVDPSGSTPTRKNSVFVQQPVNASAISISPNPFSPDGDGFEDVTILHYQLPLTTARLSVKIFDMAGRQIRQLTNQLPVASNGSVIWDGKDNNGRVARMGIYILLIRISDTNKDFVKESKKSVVLVKR